MSRQPGPDVEEAHASDRAESQMQASSRMRFSMARLRSARVLLALLASNQASRFYVSGRTSCTRSLVLVPLRAHRGSRRVRRGSAPSTCWREAGRNLESQLRR